jgi:hypothetical protein
VISFQSFGHMGRLGNQLFQYAFVRTAARRLAVPFHCPRWIGDDVYQLDDAAERAPRAEGIGRQLVERRELRCVTCPVVRDGMDVSGYFQSPHLFDRDEARRWFSLRPAIAATVNERFGHLDLSRAVGLHLRLGDFVTKPATYVRHYVPPRRYFAEALRRIPSDCHMVLSSDQPDEALARLGPLLTARCAAAGCTVLRDNRDYEDLHLLSRCRHLICSPSTFSWWAAWLRPAGTDGVVCVPREGLFRQAMSVPGEPEMLWQQPGWTPLAALPRWDWQYWRARYRVWAKHVRLTLRGELKPAGAKRAA